MLAVNTSKHEDANTHDNNRDMGMHNSFSDSHNMNMERDRRKQAPGVLDEWRRRIQKENLAKSTSQLFFSLATSFRFMKNSLYLCCFSFSANIKALDFTNQIFDFFLIIYKTHGP